MSEYPNRPQTPQAMLHRLPDKPQFLPGTEISHTKPSKYIILIVASTAVAGKVQIAQSVADALACPLFQGDGLHETSARAASVNKNVAASKIGDSDGDEHIWPLVTEPNKERYQRMWLSKMTRTGYLFPEESRPATEGFSGFGGGSPSLSPNSDIHRGSSSSDASHQISASGHMNSHQFAGKAQGQSGYTNKPPPAVTLSEDEALRRTNSALMVVTHPILEQWHKDSIRNVVGNYGIAVIFVPLDQDRELPVLKPLDPRTMTSFASLSITDNAQRTAPGASLHNEFVLDVDTELKVEEIIEEIVGGVRDIMKT